MTATPRIDSRMLNHPHVSRYLNGLVGTLSEDVAGTYYDDPGSDDFAELDEAIAAGLTEFLLSLDLPEQTTRQEAATHERSDQDYQKASGL